MQPSVGTWLVALAAERGQATDEEAAAPLEGPGAVRSESPEPGGSALTEAMARESLFSKKLRWSSLPREPGEVQVPRGRRRPRTGSPVDLSALWPGSHSFFL